MTTKYAGKILSLLLSLAVILSCAGCVNRKEIEKDKKRCSGTVEDYLEYLIRGQKEKLSRYCETEADPFQASMDSKEENVFRIFLKNMEYEIRETTVKNKKGVVSVKLSVLDASELIKKSGESFSQSDLSSIDKKKEKMVDETIDLMLYYNDKFKAFFMESTEPVYRVVKNQVDKIVSVLPALDERAIRESVDKLMDAYFDADYRYFAKNSDTLGATDYIESSFYKDLYKEEASYLSYSIEILSEDEKVNLIVHCHMKRAEAAWERVLKNPDELVPMMVPMIPALLEGTDFMHNEEELFRVLDFSAIIPRFREEMEKEPIVDIDIPCVIEVGDNGEIAQAVHGNFKEILPVGDFTELAPDYDDVDITSLYLKAADLALEKGTITQDQFKICRLAMSERQKSKEEIISILKKNGYKNDSYDTAGNLMDDSFVNDQLTIHFEFEECEDFEDAYDIVYDDYSDVLEMVKSGELKGDITGGPLYMVYSGGSPEDYAVDSLRCYLIVANDFCFQILILEDTPEKVEHLEALLEELGLKP